MKPALVATALLVSCLLPKSLHAIAWINEFHYDNSGGDVGEFVEIAGMAGTDLSGYSLMFYNGSNGEKYDSLTLSGIITDQLDGFGVLEFPRAGIQNGAPDGIALVDPSDQILQFLSYEGSFTAVGGPADSLNSTDVGISQSSSTPVGSSLGLVGTGDRYTDFNWFAFDSGNGSAGKLNPGQAIRIETPVTSSNPVSESGMTITLLSLSFVALLLFKRSY